MLRLRLRFGQDACVCLDDGMKMKMGKRERVPMIECGK